MVKATDGKLVKNFEDSMGQMAVGMKGFEQMSKNFFDSLEVKKFLSDVKIDDDSTTKVLQLEDEVDN